MSYIVNIADQVLHLGDLQFKASELKGSLEQESVFSSYVKEHYSPESFEHALALFLQDWFNDSPLIEVKTSGSTGKPKRMQVEKVKMMNSACMTLSFLGLNHTHSALLCMPLDYIAGKMLVVRALVGGLKLILVPPCSNPIAKIEASEPINFAAMIPMQVSAALVEPEHESKLKAIDHLIIGGGAVDATLAAKLKGFPYNVWSTYGMTETLSHIALRRLSGPQASSFYSVFDGVKVYPSEEQTLSIKAPLVNDEILHTNDIVEFNEQGQFRVLGRKDNVINSGGIKLQIEEIEQWLKDKQDAIDGKYARLKQASMLISSRPDPKFGHIVVLLYALTESNPLTEEELQILLEDIPKYWKPKAVVKVDAITMTGTNKPDRATAKHLAIH